MRKPIAVALVALGALVWAGSARAAEVGDRCVGDGAAPDRTAIVLNNGIDNGIELPTVVQPEGSKVITRWRVRVEPGTEPTAQQLVAFKQVSENEDLKVGESAVETIAGGGEFTTRIPVPEYGHIGLTGPDGALVCAGETAHLAGIVEGAWAVGERRRFDVEFAGVPVVATVEPDRDEDGYGDETQDACPQSNLFTGACPPPVALAVRAEPRKRSILLRVRSDGEASVDVYGQVGWNFQPKRQTHRTHRHRAGAHVSKRKKGVKRLIVGLSGPTKQVEPGVLSRFTVRLPKAVQLRLGRLTRRQSIRAKLTLRATNPAGVQKNARVRVKLRGWRRPR